jgi:hypothetical protein
MLTFKGLEFEISQLSLYHFDGNSVCASAREMSHIERKDNPSFIKERVYLLGIRFGVKDLSMNQTTRVTTEMNFPRKQGMPNACDLRLFEKVD